MNRKLFTTLIIEDEGVRLDYYLLTNRVVIENEEHITYGVAIGQSPLNAFSRCPYLYSSLEDITPMRHTTLDFLRKLADGLVDPSVLEDIVLDNL